MIICLTPLAPVIEQQLEPLRALSDFEVFQTGGEIQFRFKRKDNPVVPAPRFVVRIECPTRFDTAVTGFVVINHRPSGNEEKPILFLAGMSPETIAQGVLESASQDFQRLIAGWVK